MKNGQQQGPFSYDELWNQKISANTLVWFEGMPGWKEASTIPEFANWFPQQLVAQKRPQHSSRKPLQPVRSLRNQRVKQKKTNRGIIGISIFLVAIVLIVYLYTHKSTDSSNTSNPKVALLRN